MTAVALDIWQKLHQGRRKRVEINKSMVSSIQHQADLRRNIDLAQMIGERDKIEGHLSKLGAWHPQVMRIRYAELQHALGEPPANHVLIILG